MATSGNINKVYWRMKNGQMIDVMEMDVNHLRNVLKMILRSSNYYCEHCEYIVDNKKYPHRSMCPNNIINSDVYSYRESQFELNGDIAQSFNDDMEQSEMEMEVELNSLESQTYEG